MVTLGAAEALLVAVYGCFFYNVRQNGAGEAIVTVSGKVFWSALAIAVLSAFASGVGLFWQTVGGTRAFTTARGQTVDLYGQGIYRLDTVFSAAGYKGTDAVVLFLAVPVLVVLTLLYRRGSLRFGLLLISMLSFFLYVYASMALGSAYNSLFLIYLVIFSLSLFALIKVSRLAETAWLELDSMARLTRARRTRRFPASLLFASGLVTAFVWLSPLVGAMATGQTPDRLDSYTTLMTYVLDLAVIVPAAFAAGWMILRSHPLGYLMAFALFGIIVMLAPGITASTISQVRSGVSLTPGEMAGPVAGFIVLGILSLWAMVSILRGLQVPAQHN
jgi:hypothetical protein